MPEASGVLTPHEASLMAQNAYAALKGHTAGRPTAGVENRSTINDQVTGKGNAAVTNARMSGSLQAVLEAATVGVSTGFGYILTFDQGAEKHAVVATRGTSPEMDRWWKPDLLTDADLAPTAKFADAGFVHGGFKSTFDSLVGQLDRNAELFRKAHHIHAVGHSLGGAIANMVAYHLRATHAKPTHLYTFGAPRVGLVAGLGDRLEQRLGTGNIFRVGHHLDPITMIPVFPFEHVLASTDDRNNIILRSPSNVPGLENHNISTYAAKMKTAGTWEGARKLKFLPEFEDRLMASIWEDRADNWVCKSMKLFGAGIVWVLMRVLKGILEALGVAAQAVIVTPLDLIARALAKGAQAVGRMANAVMGWIQAAASLIGSSISSAKDVTTAFLRFLLNKFASVVKSAVDLTLAGVKRVIGTLPYTLPLAAAAAAAAGVILL